MGNDVDYENSLKELSTEITNLERDLPAAVDRVFEELSHWVPGFVLDPARNQVNDAMASLPQHAQKARDFCSDECGKIYDVHSMTDAANVYRTLKVSEIAQLVDTLVASSPDWQSPAKDMYSTRRLVAQSKARTTSSTIKDMISVFDDLDSATDSYFLGATLLVAGIIVAVVGILLAIPSGGWGLVVSIIGGLITLAGWFTLPDMSGELTAAQEKFSSLASDLKAVSWGEPTTDAAWSW
ncbi:hypothetical protein [uncultured Tessaracoccus sp.]|uniref:hypothetical protein n=1 Tax=uncultured Tessaracoccus sp. TaxID=905023 RepID=UPI00260264C8|nr:hypothetical protein [uncultured Tessaracoccus sp.]